MAGQEKDVRRRSILPEQPPQRPYGPNIPVPKGEPNPIMDFIEGLIGTKSALLDDSGSTATALGEGAGLFNPAKLFTPIAGVSHFIKALGKGKQIELPLELAAKGFKGGRVIENMPDVMKFRQNSTAQAGEELVEQIRLLNLDPADEAIILNAAMKNPRTLAHTATQTQSMPLRAARQGAHGLNEGIMGKESGLSRISVTPDIKEMYTQLQKALVPPIGPGMEVDDYSPVRAWLHEFTHGAQRALKKGRFERDYSQNVLGRGYYNAPEEVGAVMAARKRAPNPTTSKIKK